jgi:hypothetical protein
MKCPVKLNASSGCIETTGYNIPTKKQYLEQDARIVE